MLTESPSKLAILDSIKDYQINIGPAIKEKIGKDNICKFTPSCSEYAQQAVEKYGPKKGSGLAIKKLLKCNPLSKGGEDPLK